MNKTRLIKAIMIGAALGIITEYILRPYIEKPIEKKIEEGV
jgi:hypothetical protein